MPAVTSKVVFVGNLPYSHSEEQLAEVFGTVGPVSSFRIAFEKDSGKPRGFGFCEYFDTQTAESAIRNLQGVDVGGRSLRLDFADVGTQDTRDQGGRPPPPGKGRGQLLTNNRDFVTGPGSGPAGAVGLPPDLPRGIPLAPGQSATDSISQTLATLPPDQLLDIMSQMKQLVTASPDQARALLTPNPQLTYAIFQAMLLMGVVDASILTRMLAPPSAAATPAPVPTPAAPSYNNGGYRPPPPAAVPQPSYMPPQPAQHHHQQQQQQQQQQYGMSQPPPQQQQQQRAPPSQQTAMDQAQLIQQVLALTQEQINVLPPDQKATIMQIRQQAGMR